MKIGAYQIYLLTIFCLLATCSVEENEKESTIYKLRTEVWPSNDNGKIIPSQEIMLHLLLKQYTRDLSLVGCLIVGREQ